MSYRRKIVIHRNPGRLADFARRVWEKWAANSVSRGRDFTVALSGGKTPALFYRKLAERGDLLPWERTHIFWVDERFVPPSSELSNYRLVSESLIEHIFIPPRNIHPVPTTVETSRRAAERYEEDIKTYFHLKPGEFPAFDLIILGIGEDGHTASLFPGRPTLLENKRRVVVDDLPPIPPRRVTLTLPVLNQAARVLFLVSGKNKASIVKKVIAEGDGRFPAARVRPAPGELVFALDAAAASGLSPDHRR